MKKINVLIFITSLLLLVSCSQNAINWIIENNKSNNISKFNLNSDSKIISCNGKNLKIFSSSEEASKNLESILANSNFYYYTNFEKAIFLTLVELVRRPDISSPQSSFQFISDMNQNQLFYSFSNKNDNGLSVLFGIDFLLKKYSKTKTLIQMAIDLEKIIPKNIFVDKGFEKFIFENQKLISKNNALSNILLRGEEPLTRFESFTRGNIVKLVEFYNKNKTFQDANNYIIQNKFDFQQNIGVSSTECNFDLKSDLDQINTDIGNNDIVNFIGLSNKNEAYISTFFSYKKINIEQIDNLLFLKTNKSSIDLPTCRIENPNNNLKLILSSIEGRSKNQHLKHLIDYEIYNSTTENTFNSILNFPRHLFLSGPDRILYESKKGRESQLSFFLNMNFPIYHVEKLGNIIGYKRINNQNEYNFIEDIRSSSKLLCTE